MKTRLSGNNVLGKSNLQPHSQSSLFFLRSSNALVGQNYGADLVFLLRMAWALSPMAMRFLNLKSSER